jgi:3-oxoacyl-[acyl-carrier protein] reductase
MSQKRTVLITGASRGIGAAAAGAFAAEGYNVALNYLNSQKAAETIKSEIEAAGGCADIFRADVSDASAVQRMACSVIDRFGGVDILVNNAGIAWSGLLTDFTTAGWDRIFSVNVTGVFNCSKAVLPGMINRKSGKIINVSSIWGITGASCEVPYSASKAAVIGFTKALAKEVGPSNIQVNCVAPGVIGTDMNAALTEADILALKEETPLGRIGTAAEIAAVIVFLASSGADFITGQVISPNGGIAI